MGECYVTQQLSLIRENNAEKVLLSSLDCFFSEKDYLLLFLYESRRNLVETFINFSQINCTEDKKGLNIIVKHFFLLLLHF